MKNKSILLTILIISSVMLLSGCGKGGEQPDEVILSAMPVKEQSLADSLKAEREFEYPGLVVSQSEATVSAKASGNLSGASFQVGDKVEIGQELGHIDDVNSGGQIASGNTSQIKQAKIVAEQAKSSLDLAQSSYNSLLISSAKDLRQAEISLDQAKNGQSNLGITSGDSIKSAQLGYENAKIATAQAKSSLENRKKLANQAEKDVEDNAKIVVSSSSSLAGSIITGINNVTGFDENNSVSVAYRSNLGALDSNSYNDAKTAYQVARDAYQDYLSEDGTDVSANLSRTIVLLQTVKDMADEVKYMFDKSVSSSLLPSSSVSGASLSGLQQAASGYQTQTNTSISQLQSANQSLINTNLNNDSTIDNLQRVYDLAKQQEEIAKQNLSNLEAGNVSQSDQAGFAVTLAQNQYDNLKVKIDSQIASSRTQLENAQLQYNNALITLQSAYDNRVLVSPISGTVTKKNVSNGEAVSAGELVAVISQPDKIKVQFYVEQEAVSRITAGLPVTIATNDGNEKEAIITAVSPQADAVSRRFLVEANLVEADSSLYLGTVVSVKAKITDEAQGGTGTAFLPISAVDISQSGQYIFIDEGGIAKKLPVSVEEVLGEWARLKIEAPVETMIIIDGNKRIQEGDSVSVSDGK
jgi:RND family efflux transporter MFP subunit